MIEKNIECPKCHQKTVERRISAEKNQSMKGKWFVEHCENKNCDYYKGGFVE